MIIKPYNKMKKTQQLVISAPDPHQLTLNTSFQHLKQHT